MQAYIPALFTFLAANVLQARACQQLVVSWICNYKVCCTLKCRGLRLIRAAFARRIIKFRRIFQQRACRCLHCGCGMHPHSTFTLNESVIWNIPSNRQVRRKHSRFPGSKPRACVAVPNGERGDVCEPECLCENWVIQLKCAVSVAAHLMIKWNRC